MAATKAPVRVAVTGAAGQIGYCLLFRIASGAMLGPDQPVILQLLEITPALGALEGVAMELDDCAFPLLAGIVQTDDADVAFGDADVALLVGAMPRKDGMERSDLLRPTAASSSRRARRCRARRSEDVRCWSSATRPTPTPSSPCRTPRTSTPAVHRHDPPRPQPGRRPAGRQGRHHGQRRSRKMTIWGNHSATQYPDLFHAEVDGKNAAEPSATRRGSRPTSSPPCAARAPPSSRRAACRRPPRRPTPPSTTCAPGPWAPPRATGCRWASRQRRQLRRPRGHHLSFPVHLQGRRYEIVQGLDIDDFSRGKIDATVAELPRSATPSELGLI